MPPDICKLQGNLLVFMYGLYVDEKVVQGDIKKRYRHSDS